MQAAGEERRCAGEETRAGWALLVIVDLDMGQPGIVVDGGVDVVVADRFPLVLGGTGGRASVQAPAPAIRDLADLLHIEVNELTGALAFVADRGRFRGPDHRSGQRVTLTQVGQVVTTQDPRHGPWRESELGTQPVLPTTLLAAQGHHAFFNSGRGPARAVARPG